MIETAHLWLIPAELRHFEAILRDEAELAALLGLKLADGWLSFPDARAAMEPSYEHLKAHPSVLGWWTYFFLHKTDRALIGLGGYKGEPDAEGAAEIGYSIAPGYQRRGLATEAALGMIEHAFSDSRVRQVIAHTLPEKNTSTRVLERVGMRFLGPVHDPEDGEVWRWVLERP